jgi:hypothetical protein
MELVEAARRINRVRTLFAEIEYANGHIEQVVKPAGFFPNKSEDLMLIIWDESIGDAVMKGTRQEIVRVVPFQTDYDSMQPEELPKWIALSWAYGSAMKISHGEVRGEEAETLRKRLDGLFASMGRESPWPY